MPGTVTHADVLVLARRRRRRRRRGSLRPRPRPTTTRLNPNPTSSSPLSFETRPHHAPLNSFFAHARARASPGELRGFIPRIPATLSAWRTRRCFLNSVCPRSSLLRLVSRGLQQRVVVYLCNARRCKPSRYQRCPAWRPLVRASSWSCWCGGRSCWVGCSSRCPRCPVSVFGAMPCVRGVWWLCVCVANSYHGNLQFGKC